MRILIVCGAGASSGFIAQKMLGAAAKRGLDVTVDAMSETEVENNLDGADVVLVAPHLKYLLPDLTKRLEPHGVAVVPLPQMVYGTLNGNAALDLAVEAVKTQEN